MPQLSIFALSPNHIISGDFLCGVVYPIGNSVVIDSVFAYFFKTGRWVLKALMPNTLCVLSKPLELSENLDYFGLVHLANGFLESLSIVEFITHLRPLTPALSPREK